MSKATEVIRYRLSTEAGVTAILGVGAAARIYPVALPQKPVYPAIVYKEIGATRLEGTWDDPGVATITVQIVCLAQQYAECAALREAVRVALERYGTAVTGTPINGVTVYDIQIGSTADDYDPELDIHMQSIDIEVQHAE